MKFNLSESNEPAKELIKLLNTPAIDFYKNKHSFASATYSMHIKSFLLSMINHIERTFRGVFGCDFNMDNVDISKLKRIFPVACDALYVKENCFFAGKVLNWLRNINAHAYVSKQDEEMFNKQFYNLQRVPNFNSAIKNTLPDGHITLAGIITIVLLFQKAKYVSIISGKSILICMIAFGGVNRRDGELYIQRISHVDLDVPIRSKQGNTIYDSVVGEFGSLVNNSSIRIGLKQSPIFSVNFKIINNQIKIKKGSKTKLYYQNDYLLEIADVDLFISLSNKFPPFVLVDLLYKMGTKVFDKQVFDLIDSNYEKYGKLNYPNFYTDKNIDTLFLDESIADKTMVSSTLNNGIDSVFLRLEKNIYDKSSSLIDDMGDDYSKFKKALNDIGIADTQKYIFLRNASLHGYLLDEACIYDNATFIYEFPSVIDALQELMVYLKENNNALYTCFKNDIHNVLVSDLVALKFGRVLECGLKTIKGQLIQEDEITIENRFLYVDSSVYDFELLNKLYIDDDLRTLINKYVIEGEEYPIYIRNNQVEKDFLKSYLKKKTSGYRITDVINEGLLSTTYIKYE